VDVAGRPQIGDGFHQASAAIPNSKARFFNSQRASRAASRGSSAGRRPEVHAEAEICFDDSIVRGNRVLQIIEELEKTLPADADEIQP